MYCLFQIYFDGRCIWNSLHDYYVKIEKQKKILKKSERDLSTVCKTRIVSCLASVSCTSSIGESVRSSSCLLFFAKIFSVFRSFSWTFRFRSSRGVSKTTCSWCDVIMRLLFRMSKDLNEVFGNRKTQCFLQDVSLSCKSESVISDVLRTRVLCFLTVLGCASWSKICSKIRCRNHPVCRAYHWSGLFKNRLSDMYSCSRKSFSTLDWKRLTSTWFKSSMKFFIVAFVSSKTTERQQITDMTIISSSSKVHPMFELHNLFQDLNGFPSYHGLIPISWFKIYRQDSHQT